jgi:Flp pilus assembly protein TadG
MKAITRRGSVLPLFCLALVAIAGFVALSVDVGMIAIARNQCQNAADNAAMAGARALNGNTGTNTSAANTLAQTAATSNQVLGQSVTTGNVTLQFGAYHYDNPSQTFYAQFPPSGSDNYNLAQATVAPTRLSAFAKVFGVTSFNVSATAQAAHRPRDVAIVLDFSGSMNNETDLWNCETYLGSYYNTSNNTDPVFPQWGPYSPSFSPAATMQCTSTSNMVGMCNITQSVLGIPALVNDFFQNNRGASASSGLVAAAGTVTSTSPGGDKYLTTSNDTTTTPARSIAEISGSTLLTNAKNKNFVKTGYKYFTGKAFNGYTQGPGYWGYTFFTWPPDATKDWRKLYFNDATTLLPVADNTALYDSNGNWLDPPGNYIINYKAILAAIKSWGVFPSQMRAGNILYYSAIPSDVPVTAYDHTQLNSTISNADQRFWKEYIDFTIGVWRDPYGNIQRPGSSTCSYGPDFACGDGTSVSITGPDSATLYGANAFVAPTDNPLRPRHRFWFGPMTMIQYMLDTGLLPGTAHDISMVPAKLGIAGALTDIQNNHPNDLVSLIYFSRPSYSSEPTGVGNFDAPIVSLGRNYTSMTNSLWYPPNSTSADVRPWDTNGSLTPHAHGDYCSNTATSYGLMLAYNQLSGSTALQGSGMGGYGRKGATKLVILETDGMANASTSASVNNAGAWNSSYNIGPANSYSSSSTDPTVDSVNVATTICNLYTASSGGLTGYATPQKPVTIQCIAFGAIFESAATGTAQPSAVSLLQQVSAIGNSTFPSSASDPTNGYKWCIGTLSQRQAKLQQAFTTIMDDTVAIILVK